MNKLKTDYKTDKFAGKRKYLLTQEQDNTVTLDDKTQYEVEGDIFNSDDINKINQTVNELIDATANLADMDEKMNKISVITLPVSGWSASTPYVQIITVPWMKEDSTPIPGMLYPDTMTEIQQAQIDKSMGMITDMEGLQGKIKVTCKFKKPITDLIIGLKGEL